MEAWIIVIIRAVLYPIFFQMVLSIIQIFIGITNSIKYQRIDDPETPHEINLHIDKWEYNSQPPEGNWKKGILYIGSYFGLKILIFQLISMLWGGLSLGWMLNFVLMIISYGIFILAINPIFVILFSKYLPGFQDKWEERS